MATIKFNQKNGLTVYAFSCGYQQIAKLQTGDLELRVTLQHTGGNCYSVTAYEHNGRGQIHYTATESIGHARKIWAQLVEQLHGVHIAAVKADKRYSVEREFCGERDALYVARFEGEWLGKSQTEAGAWLIAYTDLRQRVSLLEREPVAERPRIEVLLEKLRNVFTLVAESDDDFDTWLAEQADDDLAATHSAAVEYLAFKAAEDKKTEAVFIAAAIALYADDECEFDTEAKVSQGDDGAFVQCWRWVSNDQAGIAYGYTAVEVDGESYEYNEDSVCFKREDGDFEFWFYHRQAEPTPEVIAALIRAANADNAAKEV